MAQDIVRFGLIGAGNMGTVHLKGFENLKHGKITAVADLDPAKRVKVQADYPDVKVFETYQEVFDSGLIDAVLIATPHYSHAEIAIEGFQRGLHVLTEKPESVSVKEAQRMNAAAAAHPKQTFGIMYQMRTNPVLRKIRELLADGELGDISRMTWIITDWFRSWTYYASGGWRATWAGEGGGVIINQCPHNLDIIQWIIGGVMPKRITAVGFIGKTHPIEVEDEISAVLEYDNGMIGHFLTTTGEAPGTNRLEIAGDRGKLVMENGKLKFWRTRQSVREIRETTPELFKRVEAWEMDIPVLPTMPEGHTTIAENFIANIREGTPLIAPGAEGVRGLEIGAAMQMAGILRKPIELPIDGDAYEQFLKDMQKQHGGRKNLATRSDAKSDMSASFH